MNNNYPINNLNINKYIIIYYIFNTYYSGEKMHRHWKEIILPIINKINPIDALKQ